MLLGSVYAAIGAGFSLVWRRLGWLNLAHGGFVVAGALVAGSLHDWLGLPSLLALPVSVAVTAAAGGLTSRLIFQPLAGRAPAAVLLAGFGLLLVIIESSAVLLPGAATNEAAPARVGEVLGLQLSPARVLAAAVSVMVVALWAVLEGRDRSPGSPDATPAVVFTWGAGLAGAAGAALGVAYKVTPGTGLLLTPLALAVCAVGGGRRPLGVVAVGLTLGLAQAVSAGSGVVLISAVVAATLLVWAVRGRGDPAARGLRDAA